MDFTKLLKELDTINNGPELNTAPKINNVSNSPAGTNVYNQPKYPTGQMGKQPTPQPNQNVEQKNNLIKQLHNISTKLFQLTQQAIQNNTYEGLGNISLALLESFDMLLEGPIADQRAQLTAQAQNIIKALGQFPQDDAIKNAVATAQRAMKAPAAPANMYPVNDEKIKRFQELMSKTQQPVNNTPSPNTVTNQVSQVQTALMNTKNSKYDVGRHGIDGKLGNNTATAIRNYEKDNGMQPTGKISPELLQKLGLSGTASPRGETIAPASRQAPNASTTGKTEPRGQTVGASNQEVNTPKSNKPLSLDSTQDKVEAAFNALPIDQKVKLQKYLQDKDEGFISKGLSAIGFGGMDTGQTGDLDYKTKQLLTKYKHDAIRYLKSPR